MYFPQITVNKSYSCEGLGLREVPEKLPVTTEILDFSFNMLPSLQNSTFSQLKSLLYLDVTRYGRSILPSAHHIGESLCPCRRLTGSHHTSISLPSQGNHQ